MWFITNGPTGKGGDIPCDVIMEMVVELSKDPRFEVSSNFKFSNGWFDGLRNGTISNSTLVRVKVPPVMQH